MTEAFDKQELLEELDDDMDFLAESIEILDEDVPGLLDEVRSAFKSADASKLSTAAHTIKSMVGNFSAKPAFDAALSLEQTGRDGDISGCADAIETLENEVQRLQKALHQFLADNR